MSELFINNEYAEIFEHKDRLPSNPNKNGLRLYKYSPDKFALQIRTHKGIGYNSRGKARDMIATVRLTVRELQEIMDFAKNYKP